MFRRAIISQASKVKFDPIRFQSTISATQNSAKQNVSKKSSNYSLIIASFILGASTAYLFPLSEIAKFVFSTTYPEADTPEATKYKEKLESQLHELPLYQNLIKNPEYKSVRAWNYIDSNVLNDTLTSGTLSVPGGIAIKPVFFANESTKETVSIVHVGGRLSGYPLLVHGGILATILDEILKRSSSLLYGIDVINGYSSDKIRTKSIELQYRFPTLANNFIAIKTNQVDGKVHGKVETLEGRLLVEGLGEYEERKSKELIPKPKNLFKRILKLS